MSLTKKDISKKISKTLLVTNNDSLILLNSFIKILKTSSTTVKLSKFGTFNKRFTIERPGRNPKTGKEYLIKSAYRTFFKPSNSLKNKLN
jgi:integration host factor subunit alpha|tara:strand:+ start:57 stop:326 length:270 start_codon:yes stop_codon:yes gene_type:complete